MIGQVLTIKDAETGILKKYIERCIKSAKAIAIKIREVLSVIR